MSQFLSPGLFGVGDIVENRYNSLRGSVVYYIAYPPEMQILTETNVKLNVHPDDFFLKCRLADTLTLSSFNGRGPEKIGVFPYLFGRSPVHA